MLRRFGKIGKESRVRKPCSLKGTKHIEIGDRVNICKGARLECYDNYAGQKYFPKFIIGSGTWIGFNFTCLCTDLCEIGKDVLIASNVFLSTENHGIDPMHNYQAQPLISKSIVIGNNCWVGEKVIILPGVRIGERSIIGAGSVVTKDIPPYSIAVGNPARVIKIFDIAIGRWVAY